jgi:hypothetical protein
MAAFFNTFFAEKQLDNRTYEVTTAAGTLNLIDTDVVIAAIKRTTGDEARAIEGIIRQIDCRNGDLHHFFAHIAQGLARDF